MGDCEGGGGGGGGGSGGSGEQRLHFFSSTPTPTPTPNKRTRIVQLFAGKLASVADDSLDASHESFHQGRLTNHELEHAREGQRVGDRETNEAGVYRYFEVHQEDGGEAGKSHKEDAEHIESEPDETIRQQAGEGAGAGAE